MRKTIVAFAGAAAVAAMMAAIPALAQTWSARCTDGQNITFVRYPAGPITMYMMLSQDGVLTSETAFTHLFQTYLDETIVCGAEAPDVLGFGGERPVSQVCIDVERQIMFMWYQHPLEERPLFEGIFCEADVKIRE